jgi:uncharacterized membrane protein YGL010W
MFQWVRRMGVHEAYHLSRANRIIHWICIPIELWMVVKLLSLVHVALPVIAVVGLIYLLAEPLAGALMAALLVGMWALPLTSGRPWLDAALALAGFVAAFVFQTQVGHNVFEKGIDDTKMNLAELRRTKNPIPILLVFYYHAVELLFALGYRPALRRAMESFRSEHLASLPNDPRR